MKTYGKAGIYFLHLNTECINTTIGLIKVPTTILPDWPDNLTSTVSDRLNLFLRSQYCCFCAHF